MEDKKRHRDPSWADLAPRLDGALEEVQEKLRLPLLVQYLVGNEQEHQATGKLDLGEAMVYRRLERGLEELRAKLRKGGLEVRAVLLSGLLERHSAEPVRDDVAGGLAAAVAAELARTRDAERGAEAKTGGARKSAWKIGLVAVAATAILGGVLLAFGNGRRGIGGALELQVPPSLRGKELKLTYEFVREGSHAGHPGRREYVPRGGGLKGCMLVRLGNGGRRVRGHLYVIVGSWVQGWNASGKDVFEFRRDWIQLHDSEGFHFSISRGFVKVAENGVEDLLFEVDKRQALQHIRYNDPDYYLTLKVTFTYAGEEHVLDVPKILPTAKSRRQPMHDSWPAPPW